MPRTQILTLTAGAMLVAAGLLLAAAPPAPAEKSAAAAAVEKTRIVLVVNDGKGEQKVEIDDLGELEEGETREVENAAGGGKVTVTRRGDELVIKTAGGREIRVPGAAGDSGHAMAFVSDDGGGPGCGCPCGHARKGHGGGHAGMGHGGHAEMMGHGGPHGEMRIVEREMIREGEPGAERDVFVMHGTPAMHGMRVEHVIERLEASASFQELDQATRDKVVKALREQAAGGPGGRRIEVRVIEEKEEKHETKE